MKKKNEFLVIFMIFQFLEIHEKKIIIYNEKKRKKKILSRNFGKSYCINSIVRLYCEVIVCIVTVG